MKESFRIGLLRFLALLAVNIFIYSAAAVLRSVIFGNDGEIGSLVFYTAVFAAGFVLSGVLLDESRRLYKKISELAVIRFLTFAMKADDKPRFVASAAVHASLLLPVLAAVLVYRGKGFFVTLFEAAFVMLSYLITIKKRRAGFSEIMSSRRNLTGLIVTLLSAEVTVFVKNAGHLRPWLYAAACAYIFLYLILKNQEDIDENIFDKKHIEKSILPRNLRSFNTKVVIVLFLAIMLLFNLKSVALWLIKLVGWISFYILKFLIWLSNLLLPGGAVEMNQPAQQQGGVQFGEMITEVHPWSNFVWNIIKYFLVIYIVWSLVCFLARKSGAVARRLWEYLKKLISWDRENREIQTGDYKDETEIVKPLRDGEGRHAMRAAMKRTRRGLKSIDDPVERVRFIYASILELLGIYGIKTEKSDTTFDILGKALSINGIEAPLKEVTHVYNAVRYGSSVPGPEALARTEERYNETVGLLGK